MNLSIPLQGIDLWRQLEGYTPELHTYDDNGATYVTLCDITGRGILVSIGWEGDNNTAITAKITIDGSAQEKQITHTGAGLASQGIPIWFGFKTDCKVEMKGAGALQVQYQAVTLTE